MSYELQLAAERAINRLRGIASARRRAGETWIADALDEIASSLAEPLAAERASERREMPPHATQLEEP